MKNKNTLDLLKPSAHSKLRNFISSRVGLVALALLATISILAIVPGPATAAFERLWRDVRPATVIKPAINTSIPIRLTAAQAQAGPALVTNKTGYLAGETIGISGTGFNASESVILQMKHADGTAEAGMGHDPVSIVAGIDGSFTISGSVSANDTSGNSFTVIALGASGRTAQAMFSRIAVVGTDKPDYQPGEVAIIGGSGFRPGEIVTLEVDHVNGLGDGAGHLPFAAVSDANGNISATWYVDPDDSTGSILQLTATGEQTGLRAVSWFTDTPVTILDDAGPDDYQGQKDLNFLTVDLAPATAGTVAVSWGWEIPRGQAITPVTPAASSIPIMTGLPITHSA